MVKCSEQLAEKLIAYFKANPNVALAYSGGVDSALLLWFGRKYADHFKAYLIVSAFQSTQAVNEAEQLARNIGADFSTIELDILACADVTRNDSARCYYCKKQLMGQLLAAARQDGFTRIIDGSNASDDQDDRPGMRALKEHQILSPLRLLGFRKKDVRALARSIGLSVWDKPSDACLATRIETDQPLRLADLQRVERAESYLQRLGFDDLRVRLRDEGALLQIREEQMLGILQQKKQISDALRPEFKFVALDLSGRKSPEDEQ